VKWVVSTQGASEQNLIFVSMTIGHFRDESFQTIKLSTIVDMVSKFSVGFGQKT